ncbi:MAG TPA: beta-propeller fold lactonase family protein [Candidatus Binataceae bacterium]|nr:beta-propeller fold lactonase family protein [Candidatus Binataceae bacterium]
MSALAVALVLDGCTRRGAPPLTEANPPVGYVYVTNNGDGTISAFSRMADGGLIFQRLTKAGAVDGPTGVAIHPSNRYLYVANEGNNRVYQFRIRRRNGALMPIEGGSVATGPASRPQHIAIVPDGRFAYVTNAGPGKGGAGSISAFTIDASTGALGLLQTFRDSGLKQPFGIVAAPGGRFVYVSDRGAGAILSLAVQSDGTLKLQANVPSLGTKAGEPQMIAGDNAGFVYAVDGHDGVVAVFKAGADGKLEFQKSYAVGVSTAEPMAITLAEAGGREFAYTGNRSIDTVSYFMIQHGVMTLVGQSPTGLGGPSGMVVDPSGRYLYVVNRDAATVAQFNIVPSRNGAAMLNATIFSEDPANESSHPLYIAMTH